MPVREILHLGNPVLWDECAPVDDPADDETQSLVTDLSNTLGALREKHGFGRGISAPQIGTLRRVIFVRMQPTGFCGALINPKIPWASDETVELWDACFSFPRLLVKVARSARIRVEYQDGVGDCKSLDADGGLSELLQHEIDHLDGVLAIDRAVSSHDFMTRYEWERRRDAE